MEKNVADVENTIQIEESNAYSDKIININLTNQYLVACECVPKCVSSFGDLNVSIPISSTIIIRRTDCYFYTIHDDGRAIWINLNYKIIRRSRKRRFLGCRS